MAAARAGTTSDLDRLLSAVVAGPDLHRVLELVAEQTRIALDVASVSISAWEREADALRTIVNVGELGPGERRWPADERYPLDEYPAVAGLLLAGRPYRFVAGAEMDEGSAALLDRLEKGSQAGAPVIVDGTMWGEVWAATVPGEPPMSEAAVGFLEWIAGRIGLAVGRSLELADRLTAARTDPLTGLPNRRAFEARAQELLDGERPATLALLDVDGLKAINDARGHLAGDDALCTLADVLVRHTAALRDGEATVARLGGDEFGLLLPGVGRGAAFELLDRMLRDAVVEGGLAFSAGLAGLPSPSATTLREALATADARLYETKRRNRREAATGPLAAQRHHRDRLALGAPDARALVDSALTRLTTGDVTGAQADLCRLRQLL